MFSYTYCLLFGWQVVNVNVKCKCKMMNLRIKVNLLSALIHQEFMISELLKKSPE